MTSGNISASIAIDAPPAAVFAILADPQQHPRIDGSGTVRGSLVGPERLALGSTFGMQMKFGAPYKMKNRVVEFEEDQLIAWRHVGAHRWRYELAPVDGGTHVTETWDTSRVPAIVRGVFALAGYPGRTQRAIEATLVKLKAAAESDTVG